MNKSDEKKKKIPSLRDKSWSKKQGKSMTFPLPLTVVQASPGESKFLLWSLQYPQSDLKFLKNFGSAE